jgi:hypothetical protein
MWVQQGAGKLNPYQLVALGIGPPHDPALQIPGKPGQIGVCHRRSTGNFEQNLRGERQRTADSDQSTPGRNIQRGSKLQPFPVISLLAADKDRNC